MADGVGRVLAGGVSAECDGGLLGVGASDFQSVFACFRICLGNIVVGDFWGIESSPSMLLSGLFCNFVFILGLGNSKLIRYVIW